MSNWTSTPIHVIDFEGCPKTGIVEYGVATVYDSRISSTSTRLCRPSEPISPIETATHGIHNHDTANAKPFSAEWDRWIQWRRSGFFAAHHASVERRLLEMVWPFPSSSVSQQWGPWIDTRAIFSKVAPHLPSRKLGDLVQSFKLQSRLDEIGQQVCPKRRCRYHCALYDAIASALLLLQLPELLSPKTINIDWLIANSLPPNEVEAYTQQQLF